MRRKAVVRTTGRVFGSGPRSGVAGWGRDDGGRGFGAFLRVMAMERGKGQAGQNCEGL